MDPAFSDAHTDDERILKTNETFFDIILKKFLTKNIDQQIIFSKIFRSYFKLIYT